MTDIEIPHECGQCTFWYPEGDTDVQNELKDERTELASGIEAMAVTLLNPSSYEEAHDAAAVLREPAAYGHRYCQGRRFGCESNTICKTGKFKGRS